MDEKNEQEADAVGADSNATQDEEQAPRHAAPAPVRLPWWHDLPHVASRLFPSLFATLAILFMEVVLHASTSAGWVPQLAFLVLSSIVFGQVIWVVSAIPRNAVARHVIQTVLLAIVGIAFCIAHFVAREFGMFFDLKTVANGAEHVLDEFMGEIASLVLTPSGIVHIVLFLAPAAVFALISRLSDTTPPKEHERGSHAKPTPLPSPPGAKAIGTSLIVAVCSHILAVVLVTSSSTFGPLYGARFSFNAGVENFGLLTAMRKDALGTDGAPSTVGAASITCGKIRFLEEEHLSQTPEYGYNMQDIDFMALASGTDDSTLSDLDAYVASLTPTRQNEYTGMFAGYNVIFISAEAFSAEAIRPDTTPTLYRMATQGIQFTDYYQFASAGTTGGECSNIFGVLPWDGGASVIDMATHNNYLTLGSSLNRLGYEGWAFHNNTYTYYSRDLTHNTLGYNHGYMGLGNGMEEYVTAQWPESDLEMVRGTYDDIYGAQEPYNVYYMSVSGHSGYSQAGNAMSKLYWDEVAGLDYSDPVRAYLACNIDLDRAMEYLIGRLEETGQADHTVIVISADHFPYGLDDDGALGSLTYLSELYGYDVETIFQRDHNRLIVWSGSLEGNDPIVVDEPVSSIDVLPTMLNLLGVEYDSRLLPGRDVFSGASPLVFDLSHDWRTDLGTYYAGSGTFIPNEGAEIPDGYVESTSTLVDGKISYCRGVVTTDYYGHVFGPAPDAATVHDEAVAAREATN